MRNKLLLLALICSVTFFACKDDETPPKEDDPPTITFCDSVGATYDKDIKSVVDANCATSGCHDDRAGAPKGIKLANYDQVKASAETGTFLKAIKHEAGVSAMPVGKAKLDDNTIKVIACWISAGYPEK